jgi:flagellar basal-body rod modification protein FlgD
MALNSVPPVTNTGGQAARLNQQDFLRILLTQLNSQNPLKPMDNTAFVAQLAQFTQLQQTQEMSASVNQLLAVQTATQSIGLLGRTVGVLNGATLSSGQVIDISVIGNEPLLTVKPPTGPNLTGVALKQVFDIK